MEIDTPKANSSGSKSPPLTTSAAQPALASGLLFTAFTKPHFFKR